MTARDLALDALERSINGVLALDPVATAELAGLHGRRIVVDLRGTALRFTVVPGHDGRLQLFGAPSDNDAPADAILSGSPLDLLRASDKTAGPASLFAGRVKIDGDVGVAQRFSEALAGLDIDWEEQLSRLTGDIAAHEIGRAVRGARRETGRLAGSARANLSEYLTEEARVLPHRYAIEDFVSDVDALRDDVERLAARLALLEKARDEDGST